MCLWLLTMCLTGLNLQCQYAYGCTSTIVSTGAAPGPIVLPTTTVPPPITLPPTTTTTTTTVRTTLPALPLIDPRSQSDQGIVFGGTDATATSGDISFPKFKRSIKENRRFKRQNNCGCFTPNMCLINPTVTPKANASREFDVELIANNIKCVPGLQYCCTTVSQAQTASCGTRFQSSVSYPVQSGQAKYGDYPWMAVILTTDNYYVGGGVLIDTQHILTTAHRITNYPNGTGLKIRLGEWDSSANYEQFPFRDFPITRLWMHESFNAFTLQNDVALIRISGGIPTGTSGISPICMPSSGQIFDGLRCWVSGWGKDAFGINGQYQKILKNVDVPILTPASCETVLKTTRLGTAYTLDRASFICAGGETNKDACTGDGGSGLVCEVTSGRWTLAGLVAWGLGCASQGVPAAYVNVVNYLPWITTRQSAT